MKVLIIGGAGTVGSAIIKELGGRHEIIVAARSSGDVRVDIENEASIVDMYKKLPKLDAVAVATGGSNGHFAPLSQMTADNYRVGLDSKLLGQVNVVLKGLEHVSDGGSFTLIGGTWSPQDVVPLFSNIYMVNAAIEGFVIGAAPDMPRSLRLNGVHPTTITESMAAYASFFRGFSSVPASEAALAFSKSIEGVQTGQNYRVKSA